jgi:hypothetical protein
VHLFLVLTTGEEKGSQHKRKEGEEREEKEKAKVVLIFGEFSIDLRPFLQKGNQPL